MVAVDLRYQVQFFVSRLIQEEIIDDSYGHVLNGRLANNHYSIVNITSQFLNDAETISVPKLERYMTQTDIDYSQVSRYAHRLNVTSSLIGGYQVMLACRKLLSACGDKNKDGCFEAFNQLRHEYQTLKNYLNTLVEMERLIIATDEIRAQMRRNCSLPP